MEKEKTKIDIEQEFISLLLNHQDFAVDFSGLRVKPYHFDNSHRLILRAIDDCVKTSNSILSRNFFMNFIKPFINSEQERSNYDFLFSKIQQMVVDRGDFGSLQKQILEKFISEKTVSYIDQYRKDVSIEGNEISARKLLEHLNSLVVDLSTQKQPVYEDIKNYAPQYFDQIKKRRELLLKGGEDTQLVKCGIREIDETMTTGFAAGQLTLFCGDIGGYKSTMMMNVGFNIWQRKHNVLYVPLEMPRDKMFQKFVSLKTRIPFKKIYECANMLTDDEYKKVEESVKEISNPSPESAKFFIMEADERIQVSFLRRQIEKNLEIFRPEVIIVDYIANLVPENKSKNDRPDIQIGEMLKDLRQMGKPGVVTEKGFSVVSAAQIGREALKRLRRTGTNKAMFYSEDIRGSHDYSADADYIYSQSIDEAQPNRRLHMYVIKARYGSKIFSNNEGRATLEILPEIGLIQSLDDQWMANNSTNILNKVDTKADDSVVQNIVSDNEIAGILFDENDSDGN